MVGPKKQVFWPKINILRTNHCVLSIQWISVQQKGPKSEFSMSRIIWIFLFFSIKKNNLWAYFLLKSSFGNFNLCHALFYQIMHNFDVLIIHCTRKNTIFFFQYVDFWPKVLLDPPNLKFYNRHDINIHEYVTQKTFKP